MLVPAAPIGMARSPLPEILSRSTSRSFVVGAGIENRRQGFPLQGERAPQDGLRILDEGRTDFCTKDRIRAGTWPRRDLESHCGGSLQIYHTVKPAVTITLRYQTKLSPKIHPRGDYADKDAVEQDAQNEQRLQSRMAPSK